MYAPNTGTTYTNAQAIGIDNISVTATIGCSGTPAHAATTAAPSAVCSGNTTTLSATGYASGVGISYQWQTSANGIAGSFTNITGTTNTSYGSPALTTATYYRMVTKCANSGLADTSSVTAVTINALPTPSVSGTTTIFSGASTTLTFSGTAADVVYYWNGTSTLSTTISGTGTSTVPARDNNLYMGNPTNATATPADSTNYLVTKSQYTLSYNNRKGMANWVSWHLSRAWKGSAARCNCFTQDGTLPTGYFKASTGDYTSTGFDRGHLCPSDDRDGSDTDNAATFKMSNISPQAPILNQQIWGNLEDYCRKLVTQGNELYIIAGGYGSGGTGNLGGTTNTIATGTINVPSRFWKVILVLPVGANDSTRVHYNSRVIAVDMPNTQSVNAHTWDYYRVPVDSIEARTGYNFFSNVPDSIENVIEASIDNGAAGIAYWDFTNTNNIATLAATTASDRLDTSTALA